MKNKFLAFLSISLFSLLNLVAAHTGEDEGLHHEGCGMAGGMMGGMTGAYGISGMFFGWLIGILFIVALVLLIVWLVKQIQKK
jgi:hypothetical protein